MSTVSTTRGHSTAVPDRVGIVKFYCAVWGRGGDTDNVDLMGDVLDRHAFDRDVKARQATGARLPILWTHSEHSAFSAIGYCEPQDIVLDDHGCLITAVLDLTNPTAERVYKHCQQGIVDQASFRYSVRREDRIKSGKFKGANLLIDVTLDEASLTLFGANPLSAVEETKSAHIEGVSRKVMSAEIEFMYSYTDAGKDAKAGAAFSAIADAELDRCPTCHAMMPTAKRWPSDFGYVGTACLYCKAAYLDEEDIAGLSDAQVAQEGARLYDRVELWDLGRKAAAEGKARYRADKVKNDLEDLEAGIKQLDAESLDVDRFIASFS